MTTWPLLEPDMAGERRTQSLGWPCRVESITPGWEFSTTGTPGPPLKLNTWLDPVLVRLTETGVLPGVELWLEDCGV